MSALPRPDVEAKTFAASDAVYGTMTTFLEAEQALQMTHDDLEQQIEKMGRELMRSLLQDHLTLRQPGAAQEPVKDAAGTTLKPTALHTRNLETIFGTVEVTRSGYRADGKENDSLHPLDGALNLPDEKYSLELRRRVAVEAARGSFDEAIKALKDSLDAHIPKRQFEQLVIRSAQDFEAFYTDRQSRAIQDPGKGSVLVMTVDGKGVVMLPEDLREPTRRAAQDRDQTFTARLGRGRPMNAKRMASVAAIYTVEPLVRTPEQVLPRQKPQEVVKRPRPENKRVWASLARSPEEVITAMFEEALHRDPEMNRCWVALVDGNETQIKYIEQQAEQRNIPVPILVDFIHVSEYVWEAAKVIVPEDKQQQDRWVQEHMLEVLRGKASVVAGGIRRTATFREIPADKRKPVDDCADYLLKYEPYLHYEAALEIGAPIATGVIEGACGYLIDARMNRSGARWSLTGAEAVLRLRALQTSGDFDDYWQFHRQQEHHRNHATKYADQRVPDIVLPPSASDRSKPYRGMRLVNKKKND
jgi:hypothetical protein